MSDHMPWYRDKLNEIFTREEVRRFMHKSDRLAFWQIAHTWLWIFAAFVLVMLWPNAFSVVIALFIIGGKQLGCAIIMHDAGHDGLFSSRGANRFFGRWFGAYPILHDLDKYRMYHLHHHRNTGLAEDPDLSLTQGYPTTALSMTRKFLRDLLGATGIKGYVGIFAMHLGILKYNLGGLVERVRKDDRSWRQRFTDGVKSLAGPMLANAILFGLLWATGHPYLYVMWVAALLTTFNFSLRVRSIAEHSMVPEQSDPERNTRSIRANWLERMLFAPLHVNYHMEHHLLMGAPSYNLPKMHRLLKERGFYERGLLEPGYWPIIKQAAAGKAQ